jgi:glycerate kinase
MVMEAVGLEKQLRGCDLVVTGEGRMDGQTARGKAPAGVARMAKRLGIPVIAICGCLGDGVEAVRRVGIDAYVATLSRPTAEADLARVGPRRLTEAAEQVGRLLVLGRELGR